MSFQEFLCLVLQPILHIENTYFRFPETKGFWHLCILRNPTKKILHWARLGPFQGWSYEAIAYCPASIERWHIIHIFLIVQLRCTYSLLEKKSSWLVRLGFEEHRTHNPQRAIDKACYVQIHSLTRIYIYCIVYISEGTEWCSLCEHRICHKVQEVLVSVEHFTVRRIFSYWG